jgi:hypothetical protein
MAPDVWNVLIVYMFRVKQYLYLQRLNTLGDKLSRI